MASQLGPPQSPPPAKYPPPDATTITAIGDDLLLEIFLRLPSLPSLVRTAFACRTFLDAVRSSRTFRRQFCTFHPPQLLGFFINHCRSGSAIPPFVPLRSRSDPDLAAVVRGSDFFLTRLPVDSKDSSPGWYFEGCNDGYLVLANQSTKQIAVYNPLAQALNLLPQAPDEIFHNYADFHIVFPNEDQRSFRMICVQQQLQAQVCATVFSPDTREWQCFPWVGTPTPLPGYDGDNCLNFYPGTVVNGFVYWKHTSQAYVLVLNTVTLQFSRMDLPPHLKEIDYALFSLGQNKDGELCMVCADYDAKQGALIVWFWRADDDGVEKWILNEVCPLDTFIDGSMCLTKAHVTVQLVAIIDGFVYLSTRYSHTECLLCFCLETTEWKKLVDDTYARHIHPYIMAWPPSLVSNKGMRSRFCHPLR
ncbi:hypothetical protein BRADI_4g36796v3 [Brachypodium distachyon]|uniref:F-box protein AT5G49610-like beta-propeller domain-containing protein n=1 Tax=Brachypodium distachyon TaxID=15368 RepID=A0A0Q3EUV7_BRADI|nr:hypothetical protein BRADI_4g36796v3 [Brachypodium distachyon]